MKYGRQEGRKFKRRDEGTQEIGYEKHGFIDPRYYVAPNVFY